MPDNEKPKPIILDAQCLFHLDCSEKAVPAKCSRCIEDTTLKEVGYRLRKHVLPYIVSEKRDYFLGLVTRLEGGHKI